MMARLGVVLLVGAVALGSEPRASADETHLLISREHVLLDVAGSRLSIGRDGRAYLGSDRYVLRLERDGSGRFGSEVPYAHGMTAANADGVIATAHVHFNHLVALWTPQCDKLGTVNDFLVDDRVSWQAPCDVEAGSSGDFYAFDQNRDRIVRIAVPGRAVTTYSLEKLGVEFSGTTPQFRVWEGGRRFYVLSQDGTLRIVGFDGAVRSSLPLGVHTRGEGWRGGFDVDDQGRILALPDSSDVVHVYDAEGKHASDLPLRGRERLPSPSDLRVFRSDILVKRPNAAELFAVYDRTTGALRRVVPSEFEAFTLITPDDRSWVAGASVPVTVRSASGSYPPPEHWRAWLRPLGAPEFHEVLWHDDQMVTPVSAGGLYQLRIAPTLAGASSEYAFNKLIQVQAPEARGVVAIFTLHNRLYFGRGESIPFTVVGRSSLASDIPPRVRIDLLDGSRVVARGDLDLPVGATAQLNIQPELTRALRPGQYTLTADMPGFTVASQTLEIGPGIEDAPKFSIVGYGDYGPEYPGGTIWDTPENVAAHLGRTRALGVNMYVDRLGSTGSIDQIFSAAEPLAKPKGNPGMLPIEKATMEGPIKQSIAAGGANGIEERAILLSMDAGLPLGTGGDRRTPEQLAGAIQGVTASLRSYPGFRGWSWAANWWIQKLGADAAQNPTEKAAYLSALDGARTTGAWSPVLDAVSDRVVGLAVGAEHQFRSALEKVATGKLSAMTGPYRAVGVIPPITFHNADEVDLQYQAEQIQPPEVTPHNVDFYKRPGKRAWGHPELWNEDGTGGMALSTLLQMAMRGADGVGWSAGPPWFGAPPSDPRSPGPGEVSVIRGVGELLHAYGPWLTTLNGADRVAIVVSSRMLRIDEWGKLGGVYFGRLYEAYGTCLYTHRPATFVFAEDVTPETLKGFQAVLVVGQRVVMEPKLDDALRIARTAGVKVFYDGTSRADLLPSFAPLGVSFDQIEQDPTVWQDDSAYLRIPAYFEKHAAVLERTFGNAVAPAARVDDAAVLVTERTSGDGRFVWVVDNVVPNLEPGLAWRTGLIMSQRMPLIVPVGVNANDQTIYDVFGLRAVHSKEGSVEADLRGVPARLFAILPRPIGEVDLRAPDRVDAGQSFLWNASIRDEKAAPIHASLPLRVELLTADGSVIEERFTSTGRDDLAGDRWTMPLNVPAGPLWLRATELVSDQTAERQILVSIPSRPADLAGVPSPQPGTISLGGRDARVPAAPFVPVEERFGPHLKDAAISVEGDVAVFNAMNWDENLYGIDLATGEERWCRRLGNHFSYDPESNARGFSAQAFDRNTAEGYHLYLLDRDGEPVRRFALYGLPKRATDWAVGSRLLDHIDNFAVSPEGDWVASSGDLGLVVWDRDGRRLWSIDWWRTSRRTMGLIAQDRDRLITLDGATVTAYAARDGRREWTAPLANSGNAQGAVASPSGDTIAVRTDTDGGRVFVLHDGKVVRTLPTPADDLALFADGQICVTTGNQLEWYGSRGDLVWTFAADDVLRRPRLSVDGQRVAVGSELGTLYVIGRAGNLLSKHDYHALPAASWLPGGDLVIATWMGTIERLGLDYGVRWSTHLTSREPDIRPKLLAPDPTPTVREVRWGNAAAVPAPLTANLLTQTPALITATLGGRRLEWQNPIGTLTDGKPDALPRPWLPWSTINRIDLSSTGPLALEVDTFRSQLKVTGVTFVEDPAHPESWLRDLRLQYWDPRAEKWLEGSYLLSNAPTHTHWLERPIEATRFRFMTTGGGTWPVGNIRLAELAFHGEVLGASHPDVLARRPVAVLFDEQDDEVARLKGAPAPVSIRYSDAYSGGKSLALLDAGTCAPTWEPPFGHALPNWDFEIAEVPKPGQYRWLQFAWKALSRQTTGMSLLIGRAWPGGGYAIVAGDQGWSEGVLATERVAISPPLDWQVVLVDLWRLYHEKPVRIQSLNLAATGGGLAVDQILLAQSERTPSIRSQDADHSVRPTLQSTLSTL
jgi:outer membrane protein assembly factor BamB